MLILSTADFGRELHIARSGVSKLVNRGMPTRPDGKIDVLAAARWIIATNQNGGQALGHALEWVDLLTRAAEREAGE